MGCLGSPERKPFWKVNCICSSLLASSRSANDEPNRSISCWFAGKQLPASQLQSIFWFDKPKDLKNSSFLSKRAFFASLGLQELLMCFWKDWLWKNKGMNKGIKEKGYLFPTRTAWELAMLGFLTNRWTTCPNILVSGYNFFYWVLFVLKICVFKRKMKSFYLKKTSFIKK